MNHEHDNPESQPASSLPRAVPRAGLGHEDARRTYESKNEISAFENLEGDNCDGDSNINHAHNDTPSTDIPRDTSPQEAPLDDATLPALDLPDPATVPELAPLAASANGAGGEPPDIVYPDETDSAPESAPEAKHDPNAPRGEEQDIWSHLGELRMRILHSIAGVLLASVVTWNYGQQISEFFARPIRASLKSSSVTGNLVTLDPTEGFLVYFQITLVAAILLSAPWILYQMWRFLEPALTRTERRFSLVLLPFSTLLFFSGCALGYAMAPLFFKFFIAFQPPGTIANFGFSRSIALLAKMVLVFGICFQVPVVTIFLNKIGLISRNFLIEYWRHAVVVIFIVVAVLTPTWDPLSLAVCAVPPCLLYGLSIWMVKWL
jgi:sec-independent protein translocase protein TatC